MNDQIKGINYNNGNDGYEEFEANLKLHFEKVIDSGKKLFKTNVEGLFDLYLSNLPEEAKPHYTCNACRHFIDRFGGLVTINEDGKMESVMWDEATTPEFFKESVMAIKKAVMDSKVVGVFIPDSKLLGQPKTGEWTHLHVEIPKPMIHTSRIHTAGQLMAEKVEDFKMLVKALNLYSLDTVNKALALIQSETMYRSDRVEGVAKWFKEVMEKKNSATDSTKRRNIVWLAVATAPTGFTHVRSSMIGTLLDDIQDGFSTRVVAARFAEKMNSFNYMRSQSAPSSNAIYEAEKLVEKLGVANALQRRYAKFNEVDLMWENKGELYKILQQKQMGVFSHLTAKTQSTTSLDIPAKLMTWEKFQKTVLPTADSMEVLIDNPAHFMALVTAANPEAENILQWDNTFSWYYHGGVDAEIKKRVEEAGGKYENNEIRASLIWEGLTDLDLHCINPNAEHLYYHSKRDRRGGYLDLDMNGLDKSSQTPVENMRWSTDAPEGNYRFFVHNYSERVNQRYGTPFRVELEINGKIYHYDGAPLTDKNKITVFEFNYKKGQDPVFRTGSVPTSSSVETWNVESGSFVKVKGITTSPNLWGSNPVSHSGTHIFFLLEGVKDTSEGKGRGFFNEMLKPELRQIRKTLELYTANTPIENVEESDACGIGYSKDNEWNLTVKVTSGNSTRMIKIDRWD